MCTTFRFGSIARNDETSLSASMNQPAPSQQKSSPHSSQSLPLRACRLSRRLVPTLLAMLLPAAGAFAQSFGTVAVGSPSTASVTVTAQAAGAVNSVQALTFGTPSLDFTAGSGGTCAAANLSTGQQCSLSVTFTPTAPGVRLGAVVLLDSGNHVLATTYLSGTGSGGLAVLVPGNMIPAAGSGAWDLVDDNVLATNADLYLPSGVVLDGAGNMYIADSLHNRIRKVDAVTKIITTFAGTGTAAYTGDNGPAVNASLNTPSGVSIDGAGNLYIADTRNNAVRMVAASTGIITTIAGNGASGSAGDNGPATAANLNRPWGVTIDQAGSLYIADTENQLIRKVDAVSGIITTVAGNGYLNPDGSGAGGFAGDTGQATAAELNHPFAVAFDAAGNMYIPDSWNNRVRIVNTSGIITTFAGTGTNGYFGDGGPAAAAQLWSPSGVIVDAAQNVYISDSQNNAIRKVSSATGKISTAAAASVGKYFFNNKLYPVSLYAPMGMALDANGNLYVADYFNMRIREIQSNVSILDFTGSATRMGEVSAPKSQTLENDGNTALSLASFTPDVNAQLNSPATTCTSSSPVAINSSCIISAEFAPTVASNPLVGNVNVLGQTVNVPVDIELVGNATPANSTTVVLTSSANPSNFGQSVTFSANVTTGVGTGNLTGTVTFFDGATQLGIPIPLKSGIATYSIPSLTVGAHTITATYNSDPTHLAGTSDPLTQIVNELTATSLTSDGTPSAVGATVTFTATVVVSGGGGVPTNGTVTFNDGAAAIGTGVVNAGIAVFATSSLSSGMHAISATYSGDPVNDVLTSTSHVFNQDVLAASTAVVTATPNPSTYGTPVTITATVTSNGTLAPTGTVKFLDSGVQIGTATLVGTSGVATFTTSSLAAGSHPITAAFQGSANDGPATSAPIIQVVNLTPTATGLTAVPGTGIAGKPVTLTADVSVVGGTATVTGTVTFTDGATVLGTAKVGAKNIASLSATLAPGAHALVAAYGGDANDVASSSSPLPLAVNLATTAVALKSSSSPAAVLSPITFTAIVTGNGGTPTGTVTFFVDGAKAADSTLNAAGAATFSDSALSVGSHTVTAGYLGDINDAASGSSALTQTIQPIPTATTLGSSSSSGPNPQVILVATIVAASGPAPTGTVTFTNGSSVIGAATLDPSGLGTLTPDLPPGGYTIVANYSGDAIHSPSSSGPVSISATPIGFGISVDPPKVTLAASQNAIVNIDLSSSNGYADTIGMGCSSLPAMVNCHFSSKSVPLKAGAKTSVQLTIDTNSPLAGGQTAMNATPGSRGFNLAGLFLPESLLFGWIFWRFRKRHAAVLVAILALFLSGTFLITGCGGFSANSATPGTYTIQVTGVGANSNITHYQNVTLTITK